MQIELAIARRADELARRGGGGGLTDLELWLEAEREVLVRVGRTAAKPRTG